MSALLPSLLAAFLVGLGGGAHCALMCGGISTAIVAGRRGNHAVPVALLAQLGRISSYAIAGVIAAGISAKLIALVAASYAGMLISLLLGSAWIGIALHSLGWKPGHRGFARVTATVWRRLQPLTRKVWPVDSLWRAFAAGALWGWLPCGMSYAMVAVAAATADPLHAAWVMLAFGIGTMPGTLLPALAAARLQRMAIAARFRPLIAWTILVMGVCIGAAPWLMSHGHSATAADHAQTHAAHSHH